jgi:hypothetical protein
MNLNYEAYSCPSGDTAVSSVCYKLVPMLGNTESILYFSILLHSLTLNSKDNTIILTSKYHYIIIDTTGINT